MSSEADVDEQEEGSGVPPTEVIPDISIEPSDQFGRLHVSSIVFGLLSHIRVVIFPAALAIFNGASGGFWGYYLAVLLIVPAIVGQIINYYRLRYRILNHELIVTQGIIFRRNRTVPVHRIQNINLSQNPLHRLVGVAEVRVETASGKEPEAILRVIPMAHVHALREAVFAERDNEPIEQAVPTVEAKGAEEAQSKESEILTIPTSRLCKAGLANDGGMILVGVFFGAMYQFDLWNYLRFDWLTSLYENETSDYWRAVYIAAALIVAFLVIRMLTMVWYILRFHGYRLAREGDDLRISCGLFTKVSASIPRKRIQLISVQHNLWMRWMGLTSIRIETAGGSGNEGNDAAGSVSGRWFLPVLLMDDIERVARELRDGLTWEPEELDWKPVSAMAGRRLIRIPILIGLIVGIIGVVNLMPWGILAGPVVAAPLLFLAIRGSRSLRYSRTEDGVVYRSGIVNKKTSRTFFDRIQSVRLNRSPFDRRWNMAKLSVDTAAAGPAGHTIGVPYLSDEFAEEEYREIVRRASA